MLADKLLFTAVAFLGTKAVDLQMLTQDGLRTSIIELDVRETLTELNVASELETVCMVFLGEWSAAQKVVEAV